MSGNIMRNLPKAEARRIARTRVTQDLLLRSPAIRTARQPGTGSLAFREVHVRQLFTIAANVHGTDDQPPTSRTLQRPL